MIAWSARPRGTASKNSSREPVLINEDDTRCLSITDGLCLPGVLGFRTRIQLPSLASDQTMAKTYPGVRVVRLTMS